MKPKTKKTFIIMAAVAAVVAIIYFMFFRKAKAGTAEGYIDRLNVGLSTRKAIKSHLDQALAEQDINANAAANGCTYEQALALSAAYYLVNDGTVDDATWQNWKAQILSM